MQPQQPYIPPPNGQNPYDFIVNPSKPPRRTISFGGGNSLALRLVFLLGGVFVLLILFVLIKALLGGGEGVNKTQMLSVAQDQSELVHLSTNGAQNAVSDDSKNFAITTQLSLTSEQSQLLAYLKSNGDKVSTKTLALKQSASVDSELTSALAASTFDSTFTTVMQTELATYQRDLAAAYKTAGPKGKVILNADYTGCNLLLKQISSPAS